MYSVSQILGYTVWHEKPCFFSWKIKLDSKISITSLTWKTVYFLEIKLHSIVVITNLTWKTVYFLEIKLHRKVVMTNLTWKTVYFPSKQHLTFYFHVSKIHKTVYLKKFWTHFKTVSHRGPCPIRPCPMRFCCIQNQWQFLIRIHMCRRCFDMLK